MSKFNQLWEYFKDKTEPTIILNYDEIEKIAGIKIDHSFLNFKKELPAYGYEVGKISLKQQAVTFNKI